MLILTIKTNESLMIGDDEKRSFEGPIVVTVLGVEGRQVRIGIEAAKHIPVHREKIYNKIQEEKERAIKPFLPTPPTPNEIADRLDKLADHHDAFGSMDTELRKIAADVRKLGE